jgi:hypothetical protein
VAQIDGQEVDSIPLAVRAILGPIVLEFTARPVQVALLVRLATQEMLAAQIISDGTNIPKGS